MKESSSFYWGDALLNVRILSKRFVSHFRYKKSRLTNHYTEQLSNESDMLVTGYEVQLMRSYIVVGQFKLMTECL